MVGRMSSNQQYPIKLTTKWACHQPSQKNVGLPYQKHRFIHPSHGRRILGRSWIMSSKWSPKGFQKTSMMSSWEISTCQPGRLLIFLVNLLDLPGSPETGLSVRKLGSYLPENFAVPAAKAAIFRDFDLRDFCWFFGERSFRKPSVMKAASSEKQNSNDRVLQWCKNLGAEKNDVPPSQGGFNYGVVQLIDSGCPKKRSLIAIYLEFPAGPRWKIPSKSTSGTMNQSVIPDWQFENSHTFECSPRRPVRTTKITNF